MTRQDSQKKCGHIAIIGRPNVGKSTLLNRILEQKISITSRKPQTTRHRILGIKTSGDSQFIYVDTPGLHQAGGHAMNRLMNRTAGDALQDVDIVLLVADALSWSEADESILDRLRRIRAPVILVINKVDKIEPKALLLPHLAYLAGLYGFIGVIPVSARQGSNLSQLETLIRAHLPDSPWLFPADQITDRNERFLAAELVREKLTRRLGQELPYALTVEIEQFALQRGVIHIGALIWVERSAQKAIVIGKQGDMLKHIGAQARKDMERAFGHKIFLRLWVKVKEKWSDDERALRHLGYTE